MPRIYAEKAEQPPQFTAVLYIDHQPLNTTFVYCRRATR